MDVRTSTFFCFLVVMFFFVGIAGREQIPSAPLQAAASDIVASPIVPIEKPLHLSMPDPVHGVYITAWTAGTPKALDRTLGLFDSGMLNTIVIDIKDAAGKLSYEPLDPSLAATGVGTERIADLSGVIAAFHDRGIYVIGRLPVFQDSFYAHAHAGDTLTDTRTGDTWTDTKGIAWLRPDSSAVQDYVMQIAQDAYAQGFDEINLDYVRFPSDGQLQYLDVGDFQTNKSRTMQDFFTAVGERFRAAGIPVSADVFGLTMSMSDGMGIGQKAELIAPSVDALAPMVYPSHFGDGVYGIPVPAKDPYDTVHHALADGIAKLDAAGIPKAKLRPWLQDFDLLGIDYTPDMVRAQIRATEDLGIDSWIFWDPTNLYTKEVFDAPGEKDTH